MGKILLLVAIVGFTLVAIADAQSECKLNKKKLNKKLKQFDECLEKGFQADETMGCAATGEGSLSKKQKKQCAKVEKAVMACGHACSEPPVNGGWGDFKDWSECSMSCGGGTKTRSRTCTSPAPANGGAECEGDAEETERCNIEPCPVDGGWGDFGDWSECSMSCGGGTKSRSRTCTSPAPANGGAECEGDAEETESCNTEPCPVDGGWSNYGSWSQCSAPCEGGTQSRARFCTNPAPAYGGANCQGQNTESQICNTQVCPPRLPSWPGDFKWSSAGVPDGYTCMRVIEFAEPEGHTWQDNFFCWKNGMADPGLRWSMAGELAGQKCVNIAEDADPHTWGDNFICVPQDSPYNFKWNSAGPLAGLDCIQWLETADPDTWADNYLCHEKLEGPVVTAPLPSWPGDFKWSSAGVPDGYTCMRVIEFAEPEGHTWQDNFFCWKNGKADPGLRWSMAGAIAGQKCTNTHEAADPHTWNDNFVCLPADSPYDFQWNSAGSIAGRNCIQWLETADPDTWADNYLCN